MKAFTQPYSVTVQPGGTEPRSISGTILKIRTVHGVAFPQVTVSFDEGADNPISSGDTFNLGAAGDSFSRLVFKNSHPTRPVTIIFQAGNLVINFDNSDFKNAPTYFKGNLGYLAFADIPQPPVNSYVSAFSFVNRGTGYTKGDILIPAGGTGTGAKIIVNGVDPVGRLTQLTIQSPGSYTANPATPNAVTGGTGTGASLNLTFTAGGTYILSVTSKTGSAGSGFLKLTNGNSWLVPGIDGNSRRKQIIFQVKVGSLRIQDLSTAGGLLIDNSFPPVALDSDSDFLVLADGADVVFCTFEIYYL